MRSHVLRRLGWFGGAAAFRTGRRHPRLGSEWWLSDRRGPVRHAHPPRRYRRIGCTVDRLGRNGIWDGLSRASPTGSGLCLAPGRTTRRGTSISMWRTNSRTCRLAIYADFQDSSVSRVRVDIASKSITDLKVALSPDLGFIRFCSAFMAGPQHGFPHYTFLVNEESNDELPVPSRGRLRCRRVAGPEPSGGILRLPGHGHRQGRCPRRATPQPPEQRDRAGGLGQDHWAIRRRHVHVHVNAAASD